MQVPDSEWCDDSLSSRTAVIKVVTSKQYNFGELIMTECSFNVMASKNSTHTVSKISQTLIQKHSF